MVIIQIFKFMVEVTGGPIQIARKNPPIQSHRRAQSRRA